MIKLSRERRIVVPDGTPKTRRRVFRELEDGVIVHQKPDTYREAHFEITGDKEPTILGFAAFDVERRGAASVLVDPEIHINRSDFILGGEDHTDSIPLIKRHEKVEMWQAVGRRLAGRPSRGTDERFVDLRHKRALVSEFYGAIQRRMGDRHMDFIRKYAQAHLPPEELAEFIEENQRAYETAKRIAAKRGY